MLQVCLNGARVPDAHDLLSGDPAWLADDARASVQAGAGSIHVHPKDRHGLDSLADGDVARWVSAMRLACPDVPVGVTTGAWSAPDPVTRVALIESWSILPDFASVNAHEEGAGSVASQLSARGIGIEAGLWTPDSVHQWLASGWADVCLRVLVEVQDVPAEEALAQARAMVELLQDATDTPLLLHGEDRSTWSVLELAAEFGLDSRIGLEDTVTLPDGRPTPSNRALVDQAKRILTQSM